MNYYALDFDEQAPQDLPDNEQVQAAEEQIYEYEQSSQAEPEKFVTFDGYLQEEPVLLFNYCEEPPKKKSKPIVKKSKKIRKSDAETDVQSQKKSQKVTSSNDIAKLQQCQMLKTIISQMEVILQQTRAQIMNEFIKQQKTQ